jgi:hypothetical protein
MTGVEVCVSNKTHKTAEELCLREYQLAVFLPFLVQKHEECRGTRCSMKVFGYKKDTMKSISKNLALRYSYLK